MITIGEVKVAGEVESVDFEYRTLTVSVEDEDYFRLPARVSKIVVGNYVFLDARVKSLTSMYAEYTFESFVR